MAKKSILYFSWDEIVFNNALKALKSMDCDVHVISMFPSKYDYDEELMKKVSDAVKKYNADFIFSYNYFPDLSRVAMDTDVLYICHCFDSPHITLASKTLSNKNNRVFLFDGKDCVGYNAAGFDNVYYMPLATDVSMKERYFDAKYEHDISFVGRLYNDEYNFFSQVEYLPQYLKGYADGIIESQMLLCGCDIIEPSLNDKICEEYEKYIKAKLGDNYRNISHNIIRDMIYKQATVTERTRLLSVLSHYFKLDLYAPKKPPETVEARFMGPASYNEQMPRIFASSKINLNISLRSIRSGIPLRVMDILGAGGFCMTNYQSDMEELFSDGVDLAWYSSPDELFEKVRFYLSNDDAREKIARHGHENVRRNFDYTTVFNKIFEKVL